MKPYDLAWQRLHPVAALISLLRTLRGLAPLFLVVLFTQRDAESPLLIVASLATIISLIEGVASWLRFRYSVDNGELRIERGLFVRHQLSIPAERVQTLDVSAGIVQRLFGLVAVEVKTAAGSQAVLSALSKSSADELCLRLTPAAAAGAEPHVEGAPGSVETRYALSTRELLLAAITSGRLGVLASGAAWLYSTLDDVLESEIVKAMQALESEGLPEPSGWWVATALAALLVMAFLVSVLAEVAHFSGFSVTRRGDRLVIRRGLFERREVSLALERVQSLSIVEGLLRQPFGYASLIVDTAGQSDEPSRSTELHPFLHRRQWPRLLGEVAPDYAITPRLMTPPRRALRRFLVRPMLVALLVGVVLIESTPLAWFSPVTLVIAFCYGKLRYDDAAVGVVGRTLLMRRRHLWRVTNIVKAGRIQFAETRSTWFQRRLKLADLTIGVASSRSGRLLSVPDLDARAAEELVQFLCRAGSPTLAHFEVSNSGLG